MSTRMMLVLMLLTSCGGTYAPTLPCEDAYISCEWVAWKTSGSHLLFYIRLRDCATEFGYCVREDPNCKELCTDLTYVQTVCESECLNLVEGT